MSSSVLVLFIVILAGCCTVCSICAYRIGRDTERQLNDLKVVCKFCGHTLENVKCHTVRDSVMSSNLYDAVDCPVCGTQHIVGRRYKNAI